MTTPKALTNQKIPSKTTSSTGNIYDTFQQLESSGDIVQAIAFLKELHTTSRERRRDASGIFFLLRQFKNIFLTEEAVKQHENTSVLNHYLAILAFYVKAVSKAYEEIQSQPSAPEEKELRRQNYQRLFKLLRLPENLVWNNENLQTYLAILAEANFDKTQNAQLLKFITTITLSLKNTKAYLALLHNCSTSDLATLLDFSVEEWDARTLKEYLSLAKGKHLELFLPKQHQAWSLGNYLESSKDKNCLEEYAQSIYACINHGASDASIIALFSLRATHNSTFGHLIAGLKNNYLIAKYLSNLQNLVKKGHGDKVVELLKAKDDKGKTLFQYLAREQGSAKLVSQLIDTLSQERSVEECGLTLNCAAYFMHREDIADYLNLLTGIKESLTAESLYHLLINATENGTTILHRIAFCHSESLFNKYWDLIQDKLNDEQILKLLTAKDKKHFTAGDIRAVNHHHDHLLRDYLNKLATLAQKNPNAKDSLFQIAKGEFEKNVAELSSESKNFTYYKNLLLSIAPKAQERSLNEFLADYNELVKAEPGKLKETLTRLVERDVRKADEKGATLLRFVDLRKKLQNLKGDSFKMTKEFKSIAFKKPFFGVSYSAKLMWSQRPAYLIDLIRNRVFSEAEYSYFVFCKENLKRHILNLDEPNKEKLIRECLDENTALGQFFHTSRGWRKPSITRGILGELYKALPPERRASVNSYASIISGTGSIGDFVWVDSASESDLNSKKSPANSKEPMEVAVEKQAVFPSFGRMALARI